MGTIVGRAALGLVALAIGLSTALLEPVAVASPIGDADNAITAAWKDAGGDTSDLGAKQGECYVAGQGFAQDFVHGKMFFTPATGAKVDVGRHPGQIRSPRRPGRQRSGFPDHQRGAAVWPDPTAESAPSRPATSR